jgi:hypothetical protein
LARKSAENPIVGAASLAASALVGVSAGFASSTFVGANENAGFFDSSVAFAAGAPKLNPPAGGAANANVGFSSAFFSGAALAGIPNENFCSGAFAAGSLALAAPPASSFSSASCAFW